MKPVVKGQRPWLVRGADSFSSGRGRIAGVAPGLVTIDGAPGRAVVTAINRHAPRVIRRTISNVDGTYSLDALEIIEQGYTVVAHDLSGIHNAAVSDLITPVEMEMPEVSIAVSLRAFSPIVYATATTIDVNIPRTSPEGRLLLAAVMHRSAMSTPTGWELVTSIAASNPDVPVHALSIFSREGVVADAGQTVTFTQAASARIGGTVLMLDFPAGLPVVAATETANINNGVGNDVTLPAITGSGHDQLIVAITSNIIAGGNEQTRFTDLYAQVSPAVETDSRIALAVAQAIGDTPVAARVIRSSGASGDGVAMVALLISPPTP